MRSRSEPGQVTQAGFGLGRIAVTRRGTRLLLCASTERSALAVFPVKTRQTKNAERRTKRVSESGKERGPRLGLRDFQNVGDVQKHTAGL
jgi:hypothetical protein